MSDAIILTVGTKAPNFTLLDAHSHTVSLKDFAGQWLVLYFYPKDNTSGCTVEAIDFTQARKTFDKLNAAILGVSPDSPKSHCNFIDKQKLTIGLLSDPDHAVLEQYGVWKLKTLYGRKYMGVERSTFLIDPKGKIAAVWSKVKVNGHVDEVLAKLKELI